MRTLRNAFLTLGILLASSLLAQQQYFVNISGHHTPCDPSIASGYVYIESLPGTTPEIALDVPINSNCFYTITLEVTSDEFGFQVFSGCANSITAIVGDSALGLPPGVTVAIVQDFDCSAQPVDCLGTPNGTALPGTPCTTPMNGQGTWNANCQCIPDITECEACFTFTQASGGGMLTPFTANFTDCSSGGNGPYTHNWSLPDGSASAQPGFQYVFPGEGIYGVCLTITDINACTSTLCDTVYVDQNGIISNTPNGPVDCLQVPNGPAMPGTPCINAVGEPGTWSANCFCISNTQLPCEADFWVMQAYETSSNGDTTQVQPIPFELWVWNLSTGGTGNYQFVWDFGDGNTSTESFPTHVYAASGPYNLCLSITDDAGCTSTYCEDIEVDQDGILGMGTGFDLRSALTIRVIQELPTGINEHAALEATKLWPNPVVEQFNLTLNSSRSGNLNLTIVDLNGREVSTSNASMMAGNNQLPMDVSGLEPGMYVLRLSNGTNSAALRFVKQ